MMTHEPTRYPAERNPIREPSPGPLEQPTLPFEEGAPSAPEMRPSEVWNALPQAMRAEVRRGCLRAMREVVGDASR